MDAFNHILTPAEVQEDTFGSLPGVDFTEPSIAPAVLRAIADVTDMIESRLERKIIVRKYSERVHGLEHIDRRHIFNAVSPYAYSYVPDEWPVVQLLTPGAQIEFNEVVFNQRPEGLEYFAGYRRESQNLDALQERHSDLTELPQTVPGLIRRVAFRLVMIEVDQAVKNTFNTSTKTIVTGGVNANITKSREDAVSDELNKLSHLAKI